VVDERGIAVGVLDQASLQKYDPSHWAQITVAQAMDRLDPEQMTIGLQAPATEALAHMAQTGLGWLLVTSTENQPSAWSPKRHPRRAQHIHGGEGDG